MASTRTTGAFSWPDFYNFPPFFTLQKADETREKQLELWCELVVEWAQHHKITQLEVAGARKLNLFSNSAIQRTLNEEDIAVVLDTIAARGYGTWITPDRTIFGISGRKIADIANDIHKWADTIGLINSISTLEEIANGDESTRESFHGYPLSLVHAAVKHLADTERAVLVEGSSLEEIGIKFLAIL